MFIDGLFDCRLIVVNSVHLIVQNRDDKHAKQSTLHDQNYRMQAKHSKYNIIQYCSIIIIKCFINKPFGYWLLLIFHWYYNWNITQYSILNLILICYNSAAIIEYNSLKLYCKQIFKRTLEFASFPYRTIYIAGILVPTTWSPT